MKKFAVLFLLVLVVAAMAFPAAAQQPDSGTAQNTPQVIAPELYERGSQSLDAQQYDRAVLDYSLFILLNPTFSLAYYERAHSYIGLNDLDSALADVDRALSIVGTRVAADYGAALYLLRGDIEAQQRELEAALADYTRSLELQPMPETLLSRGLLYAAQNDFEAALTDLDDALELDDSNPVVYIYRGQINSAIRDLQAAGSDYLDFFNLIQSSSLDSEELKTGQGIILPMDRGVVYRVPFTAKAGQFASARAAGETDTIDPLMVLVDPEGNALAGDDDGGGSLSALIFDFPIPEDGQYTLMIGHSFGGFSGNVRVQLQISDQPAE